jgi:hypothetical protein
MPFIGGGNGPRPRLRRRGSGGGGATCGWRPLAAKEAALFSAAPREDGTACVVVRRPLQGRARKPVYDFCGFYGVTVVSTQMPIAMAAALATSTRTMSNFMIGSSSHKVAAGS